MLTLALLVSLAQAKPTAPGRVFDRSCLRASTRSARTQCGAPLAFLEFAPASGAGMSAPCAGTTPTGAKGEALTFTRASAATCLRGNTTTGIQNGDLVKLTSGQPRVMPGGDGTGGLGLLVEGARTNNFLRSEEFENAAWLSDVSVSAAATRTANFATAPDGTLTADRLQFPAAAASTNYSAIYQSLPGAKTITVFVKGNGTSGTIYLTTNVGSTCTACAFNASTWTRCINSDSGTNSFIGNFSGFTCNAGGNQPAIDVLLWGAQDETATFASSYIPTVGTAVTRDNEIADLPLALAVTTGFSMAGTFSTNPAYTAGGGAVPIVAGGGTLGSAAGPSPYFWLYTATTAGRAAIDSSVFVSAGAAGTQVASDWSAATFVRNAAFHTGTNVGVCQQGSCVTAASTLGTPTLTRLLLGRYDTAAGRYLFGVVKQVCADPSSGACR